MPAERGRRLEAATGPASATLPTWQEPDGSVGEGGPDDGNEETAEKIGCVISHTEPSTRGSATSLVVATPPSGAYDRFVRLSTVASLHRDIRNREG